MKNIELHRLYNNPSIQVDSFLASENKGWSMCGRHIEVYNKESDGKETPVEIAPEMV